MPKLRVALFLVSMIAFTLSEAEPKLHPSKNDLNCKPGAISLMVVGSYHMSNPGLDAINMDAGDVLTPEKQKEIAEVLDLLAAYQPTKIAVEASFKGSSAQQQYLDYLAGKLELKREELHQIAFRLARRMEHKAIYPVDFPMWMDGRIPAEIGEIKPKPANAEESTTEELPEYLSRLQNKIDHESVKNILIYLNSAEYMNPDQSSYIDSIKPDPDSNVLYGKTDLVSNWYKRNLRIFTNIYRISETGDRILLLIGAGHSSILRRLAIDSNDICLMETSTYMQ